MQKLFKYYYLLHLYYQIKKICVLMKTFKVSTLPI